MATTRKIQHQYAPSVSWTCIGRPDDPHKTLVNEKGALLCDFVNWIEGTEDYWFNKVISFDLQTPHEPVRYTQETESARHPFVKTTIEYPHATLELVAFAHEQDSKRSDVVLWKVYASKQVDTALRIHAQEHAKVFVLPENRVPHNRIYSVDAQKWAHIPAVFRVEKLLSGNPHAEEMPQMKIAYASSHLLVPSWSQNFSPTPAYRTDIFTVTPDKPVEGAFVFPVNHQLEGDYDFVWAKSALEQERQFWTDYPVQVNTWQIPDPDVMDMITACARNIMQARDIKDGLAEFQVGPTCYRGLWVVDGHFILEAARYLGHDYASEQGIQALLRRVQVDGSIAQIPSHTKETGISLATFVRHCELDNDWERLASIWHIVQNAVKHIQKLREESKERGEDAPEYGLMPASFGDGGLGGWRPEYTTTLWTLVGLKEATKAAAILGYEEDEKLFQAEFDDLMAVFRAKAERDMQTLPDGTSYLPMWMPDGSSEHRDLQDYEGEISPYLHLQPASGSWALAQAIYPGEIFAPDDPIVQNFCTLLDQLDDEEGIPASTGWLPHNAVWNYAASFNAHVLLYAGRSDKAIDYLYDFANHATPTRVWREEQSLRSASYEQFLGDMPHNWASAEFVRLTRNLLIFERGNTLELLAGLPPEWIESDTTIQLDAIPTRFGKVSILISFDANTDAIVELQMDTSYQLKPDVVTLFIPDSYVAKIGNEQVLGHMELDFTAQQTIQLLRKNGGKA